MERFWVVSTYNQDPSAVIERLSAPYEVYNQGHEKLLPNELKSSGRIRQTEHSGHNISDYLSFIIDNYNDLPESIGFAKGNLFPRHISEELFLSRQELSGFVPLYGDDKTFSPTYHRFLKWRFVAQQNAPGVYLELANNWYAKKKPVGKHYPRLQDLFSEFFLMPAPMFVSFVPGACMIVPKANIMRRGVDDYKKLYEAVTYSLFPVEAYHVERSMLYFFCYPDK